MAVLVINDLVQFLAETGDFKPHGLRKYIDGQLNENAQIGLVDDLITTADSKIEVCELIDLEKKRLGLHNLAVGDVFVILDREEGGYNNLKNYGIGLHALLKITDVVGYLYDSNAIDGRIYDSILQQIERSIR